LDPALLAQGDTRNVEDRFRYWRREAIVAELDKTRHRLHVAIENFQHDFNIGSVVRTANAFNVAAVHIVGRRRWNRRGAMVTDRYQHIEHHESVAGLVALGLPLVGIDNVPGSMAIEGAELPRDCVLVFGQEGPGLSPETRAECQRILHITQYGSTRSMNAGAAAAIAMYSWALQHA
jgi:tRNA G18 (ribose-2'-O)-methylase SpoU